MKRLTTIALVVSGLSSGGCALTQQVHDAIRGPIAKSEELAESGKPREAIDVLKTAQQDHPNDIAINVALSKTQTAYINDELHAANVAFATGNDDRALEHLHNALKVAPRNMKGEQLLRQIQRRAQLRQTLMQAAQMRDANPDEALALVNGVLAEQPDFPEAIKLREQLARRLETDSFVQPQLSNNLRKPVTLNFRSQPLQNIFDVISRMSGVNFVFDKDVQTSAPASIFAAQTTAEDAINMLLRTNQLEKRVLDSKTLLIYPARPDKERNYKEFAIRTFYISQTDAKTVMAALRQMIKPKEIYVDERTNSVIVRDTPATLEVADRIVHSLDIPQSEVTMDVQILEVNTTDEVKVGVDWPTQLLASIGAQPGQTITVADLLHFKGSEVNVGTLQMAVNLLQTMNKTKTLANPKIRVRNLDKASINIGEQVPVVTTTNANGVVSDSVAYQNVGLTLKVEPRITLNNEVGVKVNLEVSNILSKDTTKNGLVVYTLATRKAETQMTARDDETQVLAGLINRQETEVGNGVPYLSSIPILNRLFGSNDQTTSENEIVLLITPHIERSLTLPSAATSAFMSGTEAEVTSKPLAFDTPVDSTASKQNDGPVMTDAITPAIPPARALTSDGTANDASHDAHNASAVSAAPAAPAASTASAASPEFGARTTGTPH
jgi:general secretion pathway protein D